MSQTGRAGEGVLADEDVVQLILRGREDLYATLVNRYRRKLMAHVIRMVGSREDALEITQEAFLKAYLHLARFDRKYRFSTWIYSISSNAAIDHLRRKRLKTTSFDQPLMLEDSEIKREPKGPARTAEEIYEGTELVRNLETAIAELKPEYRQLLLLRHPGGKSYEEIATLTKLPLGTVKNRIFRARQQLRELMGDLLPEAVLRSGTMKKRIPTAMP